MKDTARQLEKLEQVTVYSAGIWKPRNRPDAFEGVGGARAYLHEISQIALDIRGTAAADRCV